MMTTTYAEKQIKMNNYVKPDDTTSKNEYRVLLTGMAAARFIKSLTGPGREVYRNLDGTWGSFGILTTNGSCVIHCVKSGPSDAELHLNKCNDETKFDLSVSNTLSSHSTVRTIMPFELLIKYLMGAEESLMAQKRLGCPSGRFSILDALNMKFVESLK